MSKNNRPTVHFVMIPYSLLESEQFRKLTLNAMRALWRLVVEIGRLHGQNVSLAVSHEDFIEYGAGKGGIAAALKLLAEFGLIDVVRKGRSGTGTYRKKTRFRILFLTKDARPIEWREYPPKPRYPSTPEKGGVSTPENGGNVEISVRQRSMTKEKSGKSGKSASEYPGKGGYPSTPEKGGTIYPSTPPSRGRAQAPRVGDTHAATAAPPAAAGSGDVALEATTETERLP